MVEIFTYVQFNILKFSLSIPGIHNSESYKSLDKLNL